MPRSNRAKTSSDVRYLAEDGARRPRRRQKILTGADHTPENNCIRASRLFLSGRPQRLPGAIKEIALR